MPDDAVTDSPAATFPNLYQADNTSADYYERNEYQAIRDVLAFTPDTCQPYIVDRFKKRINKETQTAVLTLAEDPYYEGAAARLATCCYFGTAYKEGKCKKHAKVHHHTCHIWICTYCGKAQNKMHCWSRRRDARLLTTKQTGIEIFGPPTQNYKDMHALARKLTRALGSIHSLRYFVVDPNSKHCAIRVATPLTDISHTHATAILRSLAGLEYSLQLKRNLPVLALLKWVFSATDAIWGLCGHSRARVFMHYGSKHLQQSNGSLYSVCKVRAQLVEEKDLFSEEPEQQSSGHKDQCPCGCGEMIDIPREQRRILPIDELERKYLSIDYSGCFDPFRQTKDSSIVGTHRTKFSTNIHETTESARAGPN